MACSLRPFSATWRGKRLPGSCSDEPAPCGTTRSRLGGDDPWSANTIVGRKLRYSILVAFGEIDIIPSIQELVATDRINFKGVGSVAAGNSFPLEIDGHQQLWIVIDRCSHGGDIGFGNGRRQQTVLDRVLREDIAERWCDDATKSMVVQCVNGSFT